MKVYMASSSSSSSSFSSPSAFSSICSFYLAPSRVSIRLAFVSRYRFSISLGATSHNRPALYTLRRADRPHVFIFRNVSFVSKMSWIFLPSSLFLLSFLPSSSPLLPPCPHLIPFSSLFPPLFCRVRYLFKQCFVMICTFFPTYTVYNSPFFPSFALQLTKRSIKGTVVPVYFPTPYRKPSAKV